MVVDTGIIIEHLRAKEKTTTTLIKLLIQGSLSISAVSIYELYMGGTTVEKQNDVKKITAALWCCLLIVKLPSKPANSIII